MSAYTVVNGDTFGIISRKQYGVETQSGNIASANPGFTEPLQPGTVLIIPPEIGAPTNQTQESEAVDQNELAIIIDGQRFRFWESMTLFSGIDTLSTFSFQAPFEFNNREFRELFKPFEYKDINITLGSDQLLRGVLLDVKPISTPNKATVGVNGYSLPGSLQDCPPPPGAYPLQFDGLDIAKIATSLAEPFGIEVEIEGGNAGSVFESVAITPTEKIIVFLAKLAVQRNFVISSTPAGKLLFRRSVTPGNPVARLTEGSSPLVSITPTFKPQEYYSHLTALQPVSVGSVGDSWIVQNGRLRERLRPTVFKVSDTLTADLEAAALTKAGRMFGNAVSYVAEVSTWRNEQDGDNLWRENTTVTVFDPSAMIYEDYEFLIRNVTLQRSARAETAILDLVLPGAFSGELPEGLPWDG